jgi:hypothetical protein
MEVKQINGFFVAERKLFRKHPAFAFAFALIDCIDRLRLTFKGKLRQRKWKKRFSINYARTKRGTPFIVPFNFS